MGMQGLEEGEGVLYPGRLVCLLGGVEVAGASTADLAVDVLVLRHDGRRNDTVGTCVCVCVCVC